MPHGGRIVKTFRRTDLGNGERLIARHGKDLRYVPAWRKWLVWDGRRWAKDETHEIERRAKDTVRVMWREVEQLDAAEEKKDLVAWIMRSESNGRLHAMIERAQ